MDFVDGGYTVKFYQNIHSNPDYPVILPIWSELSKGSLLPPLPVQGQAGAPRKGSQPRARFRGRNDNCQRGQGSVSGEGGRGGRGGGPGFGGGGASSAPPVHGMSSIRSHVGDVGVGGPTRVERSDSRVWGPLAVQRYVSQDPTQGGRTGGAEAVAGPSIRQNLSQGSVDLS